MTKNTKNLTWRLEKLPTASEIADLVEAEVITKEEAREIMFGAAESDKEKIKAQEELIKFLQGLVETLAKERGKSTTTFVPYTRTIEYKPSATWNKVWCDTQSALGSSGLMMSELPRMENSAGVMDTQMRVSLNQNNIS
jgi:hypothetical protein